MNAPTILSNPNDLPQELLLEIFSRLPPKSVGKCRCLSQSWLTELSTNQFINSHLNHTKIHLQPKFVIKDPSGSLRVVTIPLKKDEEMILSGEIDIGNNGMDFPLGSCNGLVLLLDAKSRNMFVSNPVTKQKVKIRIRHLYNQIYSQLYGFGYDSSSNDYKVVKVTHHLICSEVVCVEVYSLKTKVLRKTNNASFVKNLSISKLVMHLVNGGLHWLTEGSDHKYHIQCFYLADDSLGEVPFPDGFRSGHLYNDSLVTLNGRLGIIEHRNVLSTDVWLMTEHGVGDSWIRLRLDVDVIRKEIRPVYFTGEKEIVCVDFGASSCWVLYDLKDGVAKKMGRFPFRVTHLSVFVETLVSPDQGTISL